jgi:SAM-dependent methyltransferase
VTQPLARHYAKLCDLKDFEDPRLVDAVREILPERDPLAHIERKVWEMAMLALFLEETGRLGEQTEALAVGAGDERIVFWLANRLGRVVATDIYGEGGFAGREGSDMDGRDLRVPDASFDVVFSLSSIEHFGSPADIARSAAEIGRVLRPGGHAFIVTECLVRLHPRDRALRRPAGGRSSTTPSPRVS